MPVLPLFSLSSRATPQGMARISAQLESTGGEPLAGAIVRVHPAGERAWFGLADGRGVVSVLFPYPRPPADEFLSPPASGGTSHASQHWDDVGLGVYWNAVPASDHPDLCDLLSQLDEAPAAVLAGGSPDAELTEVRLDYGVPLDLRTVPLSVLIVEAGSPPSP